MILSRMLAAHASALQRDRLAASSGLEALLARMLERARHDWVSVDIADEVFVRYLAERLPADADPPAVIADLHAGDLYLACGCSRGDPKAVAEFERNFVSQVDGYLARTGDLVRLTEDVKQMLRAKLLVGDGAPQIAGYTGRGPLAGWVRVTAIRTALRLRSDQARLSGREDHRGVPLLASPDPDPELHFLKTEYREDFREAFETTLTALPARDGNVLRLYYLDGVSSDTIASLYRVSERTVERWLVATRERIVRETHRRLGERLKLSAADVTRLIDLLRSQLEVSVFKFLDKP